MQFISKVMHYILQEDIRSGHFLMIRIIRWHFYCLILIFTSKDLGKYERKFMKHAIDQFSIELYRIIFAD